MKLSILSMTGILSCVLFPCSTAFLTRFPISSPRLTHFYASNANANSYSSAVGAREFLAVPFDEKDKVKALGAKWDASAKKWYVPVGLPQEDFDPWRIVYLNVPFDAKDSAKELGAMWDNSAKLWYIRSAAANLKDFQPWLASGASAKITTSSVVRQVVPNLIGFLHLETSGLPLNNENGCPPFDQLDLYDSCRVIKLSYLFCDKTKFAPIDSNEIIIKPDGFSIDNSQYHGITTEIAQNEGVDFTSAVEQTIAKLSTTEQIFVHNADFHINALKSALYRHQMTGLLKTLSSFDVYCTMQRTKELVGKRNTKNELKGPTLKELSEKAAVNSKTQSKLMTMFESVKALVEDGSLRV